MRSVSEHHVECAPITSSLVRVHSGFPCMHACARACTPFVPLTSARQVRSRIVAFELPYINISPSDPITLVEHTDTDTVHCALYVHNGDAKELHSGFPTPCRTSLDVDDVTRPANSRVSVFTLKPQFGIAVASVHTATSRSIVYIDLCFFFVLLPRCWMRSSCRRSTGPI